jgi:PAP2 superfamily
MSTRAAGPVCHDRGMAFVLQVERLAPSWQLSVAMAVGLLLLTLICRPIHRVWAERVFAFCAEFTLVLTLLAIWQYVGRFVHNRLGAAFERGHSVFRIEQWLHLPSEVWVQHLVMPYPWLVRGLNTYYGYVHLNSMTLFLVWMWWRHRDAYSRARITVVLTTLGCLLIQAIPVAPPRMLTDLGFVDTALQYDQSVYGPMGSGIANQVAAMPSVHVAWALILGWYAVRVSSSRWRWLVPVHVALTMLAVVGTANHWWLDGVVAGGLMVIAIPAQELVKAAWRARRSPAAVSVGDRIPELSPVGSGPLPDAG